MNSDPFLFFHNDFSNQTVYFDKPSELIVVKSVDAFFDAMDLLEKARRDGKWSAGFISYEAGYIFEEKLIEHLPKSSKTPLMCFGIFDEPRDQIPPHLRSGLESNEKEDAFDLLDGFKPGWDRKTYTKNYDILHDHLGKGDCYQGNLTFPIHANWNGAELGDELKGFWQMAQKQPAKYSAFVNLCEPTIISRSPELFFEVDKDGWIETHPMKGTAPRGKTEKEDKEEIRQLKESTKTQAENIMIVDLLRNDISRISEVGTLDVPKLFEVETYPTLHQMISRVRAKLLPNTSILDIFAALFPCGSITGAPKLSAMEILHKLEQTPRDVYCGAIGFIGPEDQMRFNVAIRTISLFNDGSATLNVGGGIVWDSDSNDEYDEALLKARYATGSNSIE